MNAGYPHFREINSLLKKPKETLYREKNHASVEKFQYKLTLSLNRMSEATLNRCSAATLYISIATVKTMKI